MRIILTGAAGGIGATLGYYLYNLGHEITQIDNLRNGYISNLIFNGSLYGTFINKSINDITLTKSLDDNYDCIINECLSYLDTFDVVRSTKVSKVFDETINEYGINSLKSIKLTFNANNLFDMNNFTCDIT